MKKIAWINILLFSVASNVFGQNLVLGSLTCLNAENQLNVVIDFSHSKIDGLSEQDFIWKMSLLDSRGTEWEEYWKSDCYRLFLANFCISAFKNTQEISFKLGSFPEAKYTAILQLQTVDNNGRINGIVRIEETETGNEMATIVNLNGNGGVWGSIENLIGDAMERAGEKFGKFICRNITRTSHKASDNGQQSINNGEKQLTIRYPEVLSPAYNAFRTSSIYNLSKNDKALTVRAFVSEIENDLKSASSWEDFEIINTKIKYLDQYSAIQDDLKPTVKLLKETFNGLVANIGG